MPKNELIIRTRIPAQQLRDVLDNMRGILTGHHQDRFGLRQVYLAHYVKEMFTQIHNAFLQKSSGGTDNLGGKWKPLTRETIAHRPIRPADRKNLRLGTTKRTRGLLTKKQDKLWRAIFWSHFVRLQPTQGRGPAMASAAQIAWGVLKSKGAKTKLAVLGGRRVPILIETGRLEKSLHPGRTTGGIYNKVNADQIFRVRKGEISLGTQVPYSDDVHEVRPLWPNVNKMGRWLDQANDKATGLLAKHIQASL